MKIGIAQINSTLGNFNENSSKILNAYKHLANLGADLVIFPELALSGYPIRDLASKKDFLKQSESHLETIASKIQSTPALIGYPSSTQNGKPAFNSIAFCKSNKIQSTSQKILLPSYDVFHENRYFQNGTTPLIISVQGIKIGVLICEDMWTHPQALTTQYYNTHPTPLQILAKEKVHLIINLSASPWDITKESLRKYILSYAASLCNCPVVYCNAVGAHDNLIFDGQSLVIDPQGTILHQLNPFEEHIHLVSINLPIQSPPPTALPSSSSPTNSSTNLLKLRESPVEHLTQALILGIKDYVKKSGFSKVLLGLSGGIDSAVAATLATLALGKDNVISFSLPSKFSSDHSKKDAESLAHNLGIKLDPLPIQPVVDSVESSLSPLFQGKPRDITEENIQSRVRGLLLMSLSNKFGALLLNTGNKSEFAMGYSTLYGDMAGGLSVLGDLLKYRVYDVANYLNTKKRYIPDSTLKKPPSAELRPDQIDEDTLPPYKILDPILKLYIEDHLPLSEILKLGYDPTIVHHIIHSIHRNEYKRFQAPPILKVTRQAFDSGWQYPIVNHFKP